MAEFETPYSRAWKAFERSTEFRNLLATSLKDNEGERFAVNRIRSAFDAGWNSKTSSILEAMQQMSDNANKSWLPQSPDELLTHRPVLR